MMVKKIHPFPYLELSGSEPGGGKAPPPPWGENPLGASQRREFKKKDF